MNSIRKISNATDAPTELWRSSFFWHWCFLPFGDEQRRRCTCRCVKKASRYRKAFWNGADQIGARHCRTAKTKEQPSGVFVHQREFFFFCVLFPWLTSPSLLSVFTLTNWNKPTSSLCSSTQNPTRQRRVFFLERYSLPHIHSLLSGLDHLVSKVK